MSAPHFGDRPVAGWRVDPGERDALSFTLGTWRRAHSHRERRARPPRHRALEAVAVVEARQLAFDVKP